MSYEHESLEGEKRLNNGKDNSLSNNEKTREYTIEKTNNGSKNGFQNSSLCTSTHDLQKNTQTTTRNEFPYIGSKTKIHVIRDEKLLQVSSGTKSTSNGHSHCSKRGYHGVCFLEGESNEPKEENNSQATSTKEHHLHEEEELLELDLLIPAKYGREKSCFKCTKEDNCTIAMCDFHA